MNRAYAIALNAFREAVRDRVLFGVLGLAIASLAFGTSLAWLSVSEQVRVLVDHGIVTISWLSNLVAIFLGASFLYKEVELRTLYVILAKPVARWQFVLGRYLGIVATAVVFIALTAAALLSVLVFVAAESRAGSGASESVLSVIRSSRGARFAALSVVVLLGTLGLAVSSRAKALAPLRAALSGAGALLGSIALCGLVSAVSASVAPDETIYVLVSCALAVIEVCITAALATLVSSFSTPFVTGALSLGFFLIGRSTGAILELKARQLPAEVLQLLRVVAEVFPNLYLYVPTRQSLSLAQGFAPVASFVAQLATYGLAYSALFVGGAALLFRRRDLT
ncbi:MAG: ABC transporter permease [Myxococcales bacterium]|nr:ABC transporter permease [Myxococcales bacterium]